VRTGTGEDRKVSAVHCDWNNRAACWRKEGDIHRDRLRATCGISWIQGGTCHCASTGCTAEGCHQCSWQFPSSNEMQKSHSFANYKTRRPKLIIPSMRFIERKLFKNQPCITGVSDLKIIKITRRWLQWMECNVKEQQNAAEGHTVQHTANPTFYTEIL